MGGLQLGGPAATPGPLANRAIDPAPASAETLREMTALLEAELAKLGKSASAADRFAPSTGSEARTVQCTLLDADGNGTLPPYGLSLRWAEHLPGDYDQNGEVNISDLTKLAQYLGYKVEYDPAELHGGNPFVPAGDPEDFGDVGAGDRPAPDSGAFNWRMARIDGNGDGELGFADITTIAQHWREALSGYKVYRKGPADADFVQLTSGNQTAGASVRRHALLEQIPADLQQFLPLIYSIPDFFILDQPAIGSRYSYKVAPYLSDADATGPESTPLVVEPFNSQPSNDGVVPQLSASIAQQGQMQAASAVIEGVLPLTVNFDASGSHIPAGKIASYLWDFDGDRIFEMSSGSDPKITHTYRDNARFDATVRLLTADDPARSISSIRSASNFNLGQVAQIAIVTLGTDGNRPPIAQATASSTLGSVPLTVNFDASPSSDEDGAIAFYEWDFDDDGSADFTSASPTATYTYGLPGLVNVTVKVIDDDGGYARATIPVITSNPDGNWPPTASLVVNPAFGAAPLDVTLIAKDSIDPDGQIVKYEWDLDGDFQYDVDSGAQRELSYTFPNSGIFNIWLRVTDAGGLTSLARTVVKVNTPPFGGLEATPTSGSGPLTVQFDASASLDLDGTIVKYEWDFNNDGTIDQNTGTVPRATKTFYKVGLQTIVVRLTDNLGFTGTASVQVDVKTPRNNLTPLATLAASVTDGNKPLAVTFTATGSDPDPDGDVDHFDWDFDGDGSVDDQTDVLNFQMQHVYQDYGYYNATVWVVDDYGSAADASVLIKVWDGVNEPPTANFTVNPSGGPPNTPLHFSAASSTDPEGAIASYEWDFNGDGTADASGPNVRDVTRTYSTLGSYRVVLRIVDAGGAQSTISKQVVVGKVPIVRLVSDRAYAEVPNATFNFDASRSEGVDGDITSFEWDLNGDGTYELSTGVSPFASVTFQPADLAAFPGGVISPRLRCTNEIGAVTVQTVATMPALDALGQPRRDGQGNLLLDVDGGVLLAPVALELRDSYDEVEDNDAFAEANHLLGPGAGGTFGPTAGGDKIVSLKPGQFTGSAISLTRNDPTLGNYVAASLGERNLAETYDGDDDDWYSFTLSDGANVKVNTQFDQHAATDLILRLYGSNGMQTLAQSQGPGNEELAYEFRDPGTYYIRVNRFVGQGQDYRLFLQSTPLGYLPEGTLTTRWDGTPKAATANDSAPDSDNLHLNNATSGALIPLALGRVNKTGDAEDWYHFYHASAVTARVQLNFSHARGDLDVFLYDQNLNLLGYSNSVDDDETIWRSLPAPAGNSRAYVKVVAASGSGTNYTLSVGYPPGKPTGLSATDGSSNGKITLGWTAPVGGNTPSGYDVYVSDSEFGIYTKLASVVATSYIHDLTAAANVAKQNQKFWYKVAATRLDELDSDFSNTDSGFVNGIKPAVGLTASNDMYADKVQLTFYSSPYDPALGTGNFGIEPAVYRLYADPAGALPNSLIATFTAEMGTETVIPAIGSLPEREGLRFDFAFTGMPVWSLTQLRGLDIDFTIRAEAAGHASATTAAATGGVAGIDAPTNFTATRDVFPDKVRLSWTQPTNVAEIYPDGYIIQYQGQFDSGWTTLTTQPVPFEDSTFGYDFYSGGPGQEPPARRYRIRATKTGVGNSPWAGWSVSDATRPHVYGWPTGKGFNGSFTVSNPANDDVEFAIAAYPQDSYYPRYYYCKDYVDVDWYLGGIWYDEQERSYSQSDWNTWDQYNTSGYTHRLNGDLGNPATAGTYYRPRGNSTATVVFAYLRPDLTTAPTSGAPPFPNPVDSGSSGQWYYRTVTISASF